MRRIFLQLGKSLINGHEVQGTRYTFPTLNPLMPPPISMWEVWTSTKLQTPVMTKTVGAFGERQCVCKVTSFESPASTLQIPQNYKLVS
jgi:hypothetical protein